MVSCPKLSPIFAFLIQSTETTRIGLPIFIIDFDFSILMSIYTNRTLNFPLILNYRGRHSIPSRMALTRLRSQRIRQPNPAVLTSLPCFVRESLYSCSSAEICGLSDSTAETNDIFLTYPGVYDSSALDMTESLLGLDWNDVLRLCW